MIRKLALVSSIGAIALAAPLGAQTGIGLVAGVVSANLSVDPPLAGTEVNSRTGFAAGLSLGIMSNKSMSLGAEALYVQKGAKLKSGTATGSEEIAYLEVPVLVRIKLGGSGGMQPFLLVGGQYSAVLSCSQKITGLANVDCKATKDIKDSDYGLIVGAGVTSGKITISARYDLGLQNINSKTTSTDPDVKNRALMLLLSLHM